MPTDHDGADCDIGHQPGYVGPGFDRCFDHGGGGLPVDGRHSNVDTVVNHDHDHGADDDIDHLDDDHHDDGRSCRLTGSHQPDLQLRRRVLGARIRVGIVARTTFQIYASGVNFGEGAVASTGMIDSMLSMSCGAGLTNIYVTSTTASGDPIESNHVESPCG